MNGDALKNLLVVGDRVLIRPLVPAGKTSGGLYLPPSVKEKEDVQSGIIVKVGPGYPVPAIRDGEDFLDEGNEDVRYVPLQAKAGDQALFLLKQGHEIEYAGEKFVLVPQGALLLLIRDDLNDLLAKE